MALFAFRERKTFTTKRSCASALTLRNCLAALVMMTARLCAQTTLAGPADWHIGPFDRPTTAPVITPDADAVFDCPMRGKPVRWKSLHTFNPAATVFRGKVYVLFRAEDDSGDMHIGHHTSRIGMATSDDGVHFASADTPVLFPDDDDQKANESDGGCEDPRVIRAPDGSFVMTYTQWNHKIPVLAVATSMDLTHWTKRGPVFADGSPMRKVPTKSASIVGKVDPSDGVITAEKINGKFWMYWGEGDVKLAASDDLIHWNNIQSLDGKPLLVLPKRAHHFDSSLAEAGPPAVVTDRGIVVLYNGRNAERNGDPTLAPKTYATGEALFDAHDPSHLLARDEQPMFQPQMDFERTGQYVAGTTFTEGLVRFKSRWFLYYGCADSFVGVAESHPDAAR